jgi:ATP-dependent RNA helicase DHX29
MDWALPYKIIYNIAIAAKANDDTEEKVIARLGITYGVLRRLGYSENSVEKCLRNLHTFELEEAFDWVCVMPFNPLSSSWCTSAVHELLPRTGIGIRLGSQWLLERHPLKALEGKIERPENEMLKLSAGVSLQRYSTPPATPRIQSEPSSRLRKPIEARNPILSTRDGGSRFTPLARVVNSQAISEFEKEMALDNLDSANPSTIFARMKLLHDVIGTRPGATERLQTLRKQMDTISRDYLFDAKEAGLLYNQERDRLNKKLLEERLLSQPLVTTPVPSDATGTPVTDPEGFDPANDSDSDDSSTGMLGILDNPDANEITVKGVTMSFRTMALPKHWSGPMPKILLRDFVVKQDRYSAISYSMLSTHSRARRASVVISWQNKRRDEWSMDDVACPDDSQAENYVATVALHSLTYPTTKGFASPTPASSSSSTSFRLLPASYRELWDELEASRRKNEDRINRDTWAKLRTIAEDRATTKKVSSSHPNSYPICSSMILDVR